VGFAALVELTDHPQAPGFQRRFYSIISIFFINFINIFIKIYNAQRRVSWGPHFPIF